MTVAGPSRLSSFVLAAFGAWSHSTLMATPLAMSSCRALSGLSKVATGGEEWHYARAVELARTARRVLLIETATAAEEQWVELLEAEMRRRGRAGQPRLSGVWLRTRPGDAHPMIGGRPDAV